MARGPWGIATATWFTTDVLLGIGAPTGGCSALADSGISLCRRSRWPVMATSLTPWYVVRDSIKNHMGNLPGLPPQAQIVPSRLLRSGGFGMHVHFE